MMMIIMKLLAKMEMVIERRRTAKHDGNNSDDKRW